MQPRDYRETGQAMAAYIQTYLGNHPDSVECLLFRTDTTAVETVAPGVDVVGSLESDERAVSYLDPVPARAVILAYGAAVTVSNDGQVPDGFMDQPTILILDVADVPKQSIIQYCEYTDDTNIRRVNLYVIRSESMGSMPGAGLRHYCIPFQSFEDVGGNAP